MTEHTDPRTAAEREPADETAPRDSEPALAENRGPEDTYAEQLLQSLLTTDSEPEG